MNDLRGKLLSREDELQRLLSVSQPHSLPQSSAEQLLAKHQQLEDELKAKSDVIEKLKVSGYKYKNSGLISKSF